MSQVNSVKDLIDKHAKCLVQNRGQTPLEDIKSSFYSRLRTTNGDPVFKKNTRLLNSVVTSLKSVMIPKSTSPCNIDRFIIANKQGDHDFYRNTPHSNATKVEIFNSSDLRKANSTMMTNHIAV